MSTVPFTEPEERLALRDAVSKLAGSYGHGYVAEKTRNGEKLTELWTDMGKHGFLGVNIPEEYGGGGGGMADLAAVLEEAAASGAPLLMMVVSPAIVGTIITRCGRRSPTGR
jgi:alkylation response protein AidB-like acyl-CoA dehydrogenase